MERNEIDLEYLCAKMSDMSGLPIRIYSDKDPGAVFSVAPMAADPASVYLSRLLDRDQHVSYFITENMDYYGVLRSGKSSVIIGPARSAPYTGREIRDLAFSLGVGSADLEAFTLFMRSIVPMPLGSILQMMCSFNYILNGEKLNLSDFREEGADLSTSYYSVDDDSGSDIYKGYSAERQISEIVRSGDTEALAEWSRTAPSLRTGSLGPDQLRHEKNSFIVTAAQVSRSSVEGGLDVDEAYRLRDSFIQRCENSRDIPELHALQSEMVLSFTSRVGALKRQTDRSLLERDVYRYINRHISEPIRTEDIASALFLSRSYLSTVFRRQTGLTLGEYVHRVKTERAKELLRDRSKSAELIGEYLGYSSGAHFTRVFRRITGETPASFRKTLID